MKIDLTTPQLRVLHETLSLILNDPTWGETTATTERDMGTLVRASEVILEGWRAGGRAESTPAGIIRAPRTSVAVSDADHAVLDAAWHKAFDALRAAGLEADADDPIATHYRAASDAVNHANRSRDFSIATSRSTS